MNLIAKEGLIGLILVGDFSVWVEKDLNPHIDSI